MWSPDSIVAAIAAVVALVAVIVGPFITVRASKTQMLGPMRQAWINSLRDAVADYAARLQAGREVDPTLRFSKDEAIRLEADAALHAHLTELHVLKGKIRLLINPKEVEHTELVRLVDVAFDAYVAGKKSTTPLDTVVEALYQHTQDVLKKEWEVVKN